MSDTAIAAYPVATIRAVPVIYPNALPLIFAPATILRTRCMSVDIDALTDAGRAELRSFMTAMVSTVLMYDALGLAAPQVGVSKRVIVYRANSKAEPTVFINPSLINARGTMGSTEGCLSIPGQRRKVKRSQSVTIVGFDRNLNPVTLHLTNMAACVAQHEVDHLNGRLMTELPRA